ncbi:DUF6745 domain-containing protein [Actinoplanes sp. NPDC024001]|uniref:DUF6745 domain-containing protein n=1 Tax=Actinoplanes sp. NPDC024001 TaxID=3154598 RepID=UPI0033F1BD04
MRLTHAQEAMAAAIEDQWLASALATGPADLQAAEQGVREAYALVGAEPPERIFWLGSPRAGAAAMALLSGAAVPEGPSWVAEVVEELRAQGWRPESSAGRMRADSWESGRRSLSDQTRGGAGRSLGGDGRPFGGQVRGGAGRSLRHRVRTEPWAAARAAAAAELGADGWAQLGAAAGRRSWGLVMDRVAGRLRLRLGEDLAADLPAARSPVLDAIYGQHDGAWLSTFEAADRLCPQAGLMKPLAGLAAVARHAGWWWASERFAVLTARPGTLARDNVGRLHRGEGAAMEFPDGYGLWAWRGMPIPVSLAAELPRLSIERIRAESNAEIRRVMLEHFGYDRYLRESGARELNTDATGTLWFLDLPGDEPLVMVEVVNATPEPDGTSRVYWLRVPPGTRTAREGVAWTFGLSAEEYQPLVQT